MARLSTWVLTAWVLSAWVPLASADVGTGQELYDDRGCANCHMIGGEGGAVGPDLTGAGAVPGHDRDWHVRHLLAPAEVVDGSFMPVLVQNEAEAGHLADYLMTLTGSAGDAAAEPAPAPAAAPKPAPAKPKPAPAVTRPAVSTATPSAATADDEDEVTDPAKAIPAPGGLVGDPATGEALYTARGCPLCHTIDGEGGTVGPDLSGAANDPAHDMAWHMAYVMDPQSLVPSTRMPAVIQDRQEAAHVAAYLMTRITGAAPAPKGPDPAAGQQVYAKRGCKACHSIRGTGGGLGPDLTFEGEVAGHDADWHRRHLANPKSTSPGSTMPRFNLPEKEREDLIAYLMSLVRLAEDKTLSAPLSARFIQLGAALEDLKHRVEEARVNGRNVDDYNVTLGQAWTHVGAVEEMIRNQNVVGAEAEIVEGEAMASDLENTVHEFEMELQMRRYVGGIVLFLLLLGAWVLTKKVNLLSLEWKAQEAAREPKKPRQALPPGDDAAPEDGG